MRPGAPGWRAATHSRGLLRGWMRRDRSADADITNCCASLPGWHRARRRRPAGGAPDTSLLYLRSQAGRHLEKSLTAPVLIACSAVYCSGYRNVTCASTIP